MTHRSCLLIISILIAGCSNSTTPQENLSSENITNNSVTGFKDTVKASDGSAFVVSHNTTFKQSDLPTNTDLKMVDNDLAKYAISLCSDNFAAIGHLVRCDLYVQQDKGGSLIGYTVLGQGTSGAAFYTTADLNPAKGGGAIACAFGGKLGDDVRSISGDFDSSLSYSAWEKEPGNWLTSTGETGDDQNFSYGMWYVHKKGDKFRITQERWNPCYASAKNGYIDDVFYRALKLEAASRIR